MTGCSLWHVAVDLIGISFGERLPGGSLGDCCAFSTDVIVIGMAEDGRLALVALMGVSIF